MKKILIFAIAIILIVSGFFIWWQYAGKTFTGVIEDTSPPPKACTQEAKQCSDGSYVGRTGPNCEFSACPSDTSSGSDSSGINGYIHMGPTCPVEKFPPDPNCADKPYTKAVITITSTTGKQYKDQTDGAGNFNIAIPPGNYTLTIAPTNIFPSCEEKQVIVTTNKFTNVDISCDTGIR